MKKMKSFRVKDFLFLYGNDKFKSHFAVVISKKVEKTAVKRNRYRRLVYHQFEKVFLPKSKKLNLICLYKGRKIPENTQDIKKATQELFQYLEKKNLL